MLNLRDESTRVITTWPSLGPPPRRVRVRRSALATIVGIPAALLAVAGMMLRAYNQEIDELQGIIASGQETSAELIGRDTNGFRKKSYFVLGRYRVNGQEYQAAFESQALYDAARQGQIVTVLYVPATPWLVELGTRADVRATRDAKLTQRWVGPGLLVTPGIFTFLILGHRVRRRLRLARDGTLRWGTVTKVQELKDHALVTIHVNDSLGTVTQICGASAEFARHQPVDSRAAVLSHPDDPSRFSLCETVMSGLAVDVEGGL